MSCWCSLFGKYSSSVRPFTVNEPEPGARRTRAMACLRRPTAWPPMLTTRGALGASAAGGSVEKLSGASMESAIFAMSDSPRALLGDLVERVGGRLLRRVRVLRACVDLQLLDLGAAERVLRQHAADRLLDGADRVAVEHLRVA